MPYNQIWLQMAFKENYPNLQKQDGKSYLKLYKISQSTQINYFQEASCMSNSGLTWW